MVIDKMFYIILSTGIFHFTMDEDKVIHNQEDYDSTIGKLYSIDQIKVKLSSTHCFLQLIKNDEYPITREFVVFCGSSDIPYKIARD